MEDTQGVSTEHGVGLAMFEWGSFLGFAAFGLPARSGWFKGVIIEVPYRGREVPVKSQGVEEVVTASLVRGGSQGGRCCFAWVVAAFMLSMGT